MAAGERPVQFKDLRLDTDFGRHRPWAESENSADQENNSGFDSGTLFSIGAGFGSSEKEIENLAQTDIEHESTAPITIHRASSPPSEFPPVESQVLTEVHDGGSHGGSVTAEDFLRNRTTSIAFNSKVRLDSGDQRPIENPLEKQRNRFRGRSIFQAMADDMAKQNARSRSESEKDHQDHQDPQNREPTQEHSPRDHWNQEAHQGEPRFPLLQETVDELAQEGDRDRMFSFSSTSTVLSGSEVKSLIEDHAPENITPPTASNGKGSDKSSSWPTARPRRIPTSESRSPNSPLHSWTPIGRPASMRSSRPSSRQSTSAGGSSPAYNFLRSFSMREEKPPSPDDAGQTVGDEYVLGRQIGHGGFSVIKEAFQIYPSDPTAKKRLLAVKIVRHTLAGRSESENEFLRAEFDHEVDLWRFLRHPRILALEAVYKTDFGTFCFIPLNMGGTLFDLIHGNRQGLKEPLSRNLVYQLADALRYLHEDIKVAHRDVKLENCLLERSDNTPGSEYLLRLCDFGMAEWLSADDGQGQDADRPPIRPMGPADTSSSAFAGGSLEYAAPEILRLSESQSRQQIERETDCLPITIPISAAVDIWAYGVCVYTLVVGSRPFQNTEVVSRTWADINQGRWNRERLRQKGGDQVMDLVERGCLVDNVHMRWTIGEVLRCQWLEGFLEEKDTHDFSNGWQ